MKNKLLLFTSSHITGSGGIASYARDFVSVMRQNYEIVLITGEPVCETVSGVSRSIHWDFADWGIKNALELIKFVDDENPCIIVNSGVAILSLISPYINDNVKLVSISHFVNKQLAWVAGFNHGYTDAIITLSSYGKEYIERFFHIKDKFKTHVIYNFMKHRLPSFSSKIRNDVPVIVFPGGSNYYKGADVVCRVLRGLLKTELKFKFYWLGNVNIAGSQSRFSLVKSIKEYLINIHQNI